LTSPRNTFENSASPSLRVNAINALRLVEVWSAPHLWEKGLVHKVKPANILVNVATAELRLTGSASHRASSPNGSRGSPTA